MFPNLSLSHRMLLLRSCAILFCALFLYTQIGFSQAHRSTKSSSELLHELLSIQNRSSVLYVAAHPDDENTRLIAYLRNEMHADVTYLSITRGDGGQNLIGTELREDLGLIRTNELLKARSVDGGKQLFTRANDFGYSKHHNETLVIWEKEKVLSDVVRAIRKTQPDIIITRFDTTGGSTHGHHSASAILAIEAFDLAADKNAYPEHFADGLAPWQAKSIFWNAYSWRGVSEDILSHPELLTLDVGAQNTLLGYTYDELAALSRSKHKSQGFGSSPRYGSLVEYLIPWKNGLSIEQFNSTLSTTWQNNAPLQKASASLAKLIASFDIMKPQLSVVDALKLSKNVENINPKVAAELVQWAFEASGLTARFYSPETNLVEGNTYSTRLEIANPLGIDAQVYALNVGTEAVESIENAEIGNDLWATTHALTITQDALLSSPYWLTNKAAIGMYNVAKTSNIGLPMNPTLLASVWSLEIEGQRFMVDVPLEHSYTDPVKGEVVEPIGIMPKITLEVDENLSIKSDASPFNVLLQLTNHTNSTVSLSLGAALSNQRWNIDFNQKTHTLVAGEKKVVEVELTAESANGVCEVAFYAEVAGKKYNRHQSVISYDHLPLIKSLKRTEVKLVQLDVQSTAKKVLYINGAGDKVAEGIRKMGVEVLEVEPEALSSQDLSQFDAVISGIRAYNVASDELEVASQQLNEYVLNGGNYVIQYNTLSRGMPDQLGPLAFSISRDRVTDEFSEVRILAANNPVLNSPNAITQADFTDWVQERGLYFASSWDAAFQPILSMNDIGESPKEGSLLVASHGKGTVVFTGLSFFRELPAGVPGAYRLLANILSL
jgi:LmbE family N-acetylglucosaminyl deacetylase